MFRMNVAIFITWQRHIKQQPEKDVKILCFVNDHAYNDIFGR